MKKLLLALIVVAAMATTMAVASTGSAIALTLPSDVLAGEPPAVATHPGNSPMSGGEAFCPLTATFD